MKKVLLLWVFKKSVVEYLSNVRERKKSLIGIAAEKCIEFVSFSFENFFYKLHVYKTDILGSDNR